MKNNCFHCGLEVPENVRFPIRFENEEHETCCAGCQAVAQSIIDTGLGSYYKQRTAEAEKAVLPPPDMLAQTLRLAGSTGRFCGGGAGRRT